MLIRMSAKRRAEDDPLPDVRVKQAKLSLLPNSVPSSYLCDINKAEDIDENLNGAVTAIANRDIDCIIYAYCKNCQPQTACSEQYPVYDKTKHGAPVYVGQTRQKLKCRDVRHLNSDKTSFDRQYSDRAQYTLVKLAVKTFRAAKNPEQFVQQTLKPAHAWMDARETHFIKKFRTYVHGLNSTLGGQQWKTSFHYFKNAIIKLNTLYDKKYMPKFREFYSKHGHLNAPCDYPIIGRVVDKIRSRRQFIPNQFEAELADMGGISMENQVKAQAITRWENNYMPHLREFYSNHGHLNVPASYPIIGSLLQRIRVKKTLIPNQFEAELSGMGGILRKQNNCT